MKKIYITLVLWLTTTSFLQAGFLVGFQFPTLHNISKIARGWYRTPASDTNVEIDYRETLLYWGAGLMFEMGLNPGFAGMRITPSMYSASTQVSTENFTLHTYDLLGFNNEQAQTLATQNPSTIYIKESALGTGLVFKYNFPVKFKEKTPFLKGAGQVLRVLRPWLGLGPMMITFSRQLQAGEGSSAEYAAFTYTDFYFLIGGGFNMEFHQAIKEIPKNIIVSLEFLYSMNLTPDNDLTTNDDTIQYDQTGFIFNLGFGYRL